jgi:hypothetical protein
MVESNGGVTANDLFRSGLPTAEQLRVRYPAHDFDGYWFLGGLRGEGPFTAIMVGLGLGVNDGYDWGFREVTPDPDYSLYTCRLVGPATTVGFGRQPIHRHEFSYDRERPVIQLSDEVEFSILEDRIHLRLASPDGAQELVLAGRIAPMSCWTPDLVFRGTCFLSVAMFAIEFEGQYRDGDEVHLLSGVGTLDHPVGRLFRSPVSAGMGWWEYNCFMLDDEYGLFLWYIADRDGATTLATVATDFPDHSMHVGDLEIRYTRWEERGPVVMPRRWAIASEMDHGRLEAVIDATGPAWDGVPHERGTPFPNFALALDGCLLREGDVHPIVGRGTGETVVSERDPYRDVPQDPW